MKLNQLGLTPAGVKATKKLSHQVHKATVAAAMEPKLKLGVVGIEIGQEQSSGLTSITESAGSVIASLIKAADALEYPWDLPDANQVDAWNVAIEMGRLCNGNDKAKAEHALQLAKSLVAITRPNVNTEIAKELLALGITAGPIGKSAIGISSIADFGEGVKEQLLIADRILDYIVFIIGTAVDQETDPLDRKMAIAICRKAGFKV